MKVRTILVVASVAALGGYALYDYYSPDSRRARELHIVETLKPDVKPHGCLPPGPLQKAFAVVVTLDAEPVSRLDSDARKRGLVKHDCIRGANNHATLDRLMDAAGDDLVPYAAKVMRPHGRGSDSNAYSAVKKTCRPITALSRGGRTGERKGSR